MICQLRPGVQWNTYHWQATIRFLRHKLQKGLLTRGKKLKVEDMIDMSSFLEKLEETDIPSKTIIRATRIPRLLKEIKKLQEIPNQDEFDIKGRAGSLLEKWEAALNFVPLVIDLTESGSGKSPTSIPDDSDGLSACISPSSKFPFLFPHSGLTHNSKSK